ncbi:MAG: putative signal transduction protein with domain containing protein [Firmicutes bacterium]|nr:putative signal transduction protein with domain containing protein [Bacillota bacterium]
MIRFENISKSYEHGHKVINDINLHIKEGEILVFIGSSGCGKTTTMKMINRLVEPTTGKIFIKGEDISKLNPVELRRNIGYVIQHVGLLPHMTIAENVALVPKLKQWEKNAYVKRVNELLHMVNLDPEIYSNRYPSELSGGQQQRIGVIRAMAADPPIILMDEPFSALDPISREQLQDELVRLQETISKTIVFVTHDIDEAIKIANRICIIKDGNIVQLDTPERILRHPANDFVKEFIGVNRLEEANILPSIQEIMIKPVTARPSKGLAEAIVFMRQKKVHTLLIVDNNQKLLGTVSVWDIHSNFQKEDVLLKDIMKPVINTIKVSQSLSEALQIISKHHVSYLIVMSEENKLVGVITQSSLVDVMADRLQEDNNSPVIEEGAI